MRLATSGSVARQIRPGDLKIQDRLPVGFVFGMQKRQGFGFVLRKQAALLAGGGVLAVINALALKEDEFLFHNWFSVRDTSPCSTAL